MKHFLVVIFGIWSEELIGMIRDGIGLWGLMGYRRREVKLLDLSLV